LVPERPRRAGHRERLGQRRHVDHGHSRARSGSCREEPGLAGRAQPGEALL
jgi:hypothetical protein